MLKKYKGHVWLTGLVALLFLLTACGAGGSTPPAQTLQNSITAMRQLKSVHFDLQSTTNVQTTPQNNGNNPGVSFNVTGHGDAAAPNQVTLNLSMGQNPLLALISTGGKVYIQGSNGKWYVVDQSQIPDGFQKFFQQDLGQIEVDLEKAQLIDHGQEVVGGVALDHITATFDAATLQQISTQFNDLLPASMQSNQNALKQAALDLWIDQSTWYIHQAKLNVAASVDLSKLPKISVNGQTINLPAKVLPITLTAQVGFSKFNQPVNIQPPSGAVPFQQH